ncbi:hypothetical protein [Blastococcus sp. SYSU D00813]
MDGRVGLLVPCSSHVHDVAPTRHLVGARLQALAAQVVEQRRLAAAVPAPAAAG